MSESGRPPTTGNFETRAELEWNVLAMIASGIPRKQVKEHCGVKEGTLTAIIIKHRSPPEPPKPPPPVQLLPPGAESRGGWITPNLTTYAGTKP